MQLSIEVFDATLYINSFRCKIRGEGRALELRQQSTVHKPTALSGVSPLLPGSYLLSDEWDFPFP